MLDKAVEGLPQRHQTGDLRSMHIGDAAGQRAMPVLPPLRDAAFLEPGIERIEQHLVGLQQIGPAREGPAL